jgi:hypothetical protein
VRRHELDSVRVGVQRRVPESAIRAYLQRPSGNVTRLDDHR